MTTFNDLLGDMPKKPCPPAPGYHVDSYACLYGLVGGDPPAWLPCDCEDPASPWPPRPAVAGPRGCSCYHCADKSQRDKGLEPCEIYDHHCDYCHDKGLCSAMKCKESM